LKTLSASCFMAFAQGTKIESETNESTSMYTSLTHTGSFFYQVANRKTKINNCNRQWGSGTHCIVTTNLEHSIHSVAREVEDLRNEDRIGYTLSELKDGSDLQYSKSSR
jgi:hypothetical protein